MRTIRDEWIEYKEKVVPADAPPIQLQETRRTFYAGAHAILMMQWKMSASNVSDDIGVTTIEGWHRECVEFNAVIGTPAEHLYP